MNLLVDHKTLVLYIIVTVATTDVLIVPSSTWRAVYPPLVFYSLASHQTDVLTPPLSNNSPQYLPPRNVSSLLFLLYDHLSERKRWLWQRSGWLRVPYLKLSARQWLGETGASNTHKKTCNSTENWSGRMQRLAAPGWMEATLAVHDFHVLCLREISYRKTWHTRPNTRHSTNVRLMLTQRPRAHVKYRRRWANIKAEVFFVYD